eukprot:11085643-Alexandrium_andersonii.AAC.1
MLWLVDVVCRTSSVDLPSRCVRAPWRAPTTGPFRSARRRALATVHLGPPRARARPQVGRPYTQDAPT